jgi:hypothetical protein
MGPIGLPELIVLFVLGLICVGIAVGGVALVVYLTRRTNTGGPPPPPPSPPR